MNGACPFTSLRRARSIETHSTRSTSGNSCIRPDPRGHSIAKVLLDEWVMSRSPSSAHTLTRFPPGCRRSPRKTADALGSLETDLLFELPVGGVKRILAGEVLTLRDGPGGIVFSRPERPARVGDQDLDRALRGRSGTAAGLHWSRPWVAAILPPGS